MLSLITYVLTRLVLKKTAVALSRGRLSRGITLTPRFSPQFVPLFFCFVLFFLGGGAGPAPHLRQRAALRGRAEAGRGRGGVAMATGGRAAGGAACRAQTESGGWGRGQAGPGRLLPPSFTPSLPPFFPASLPGSLPPGLPPATARSRPGPSMAEHFDRTPGAGRDRGRGGAADGGGGGAACPGGDGSPGSEAAEALPTKAGGPPQQEGLRPPKTAAPGSGGAGKAGRPPAAPLPPPRPAAAPLGSGGGGRVCACGFPFPFSLSPSLPPGAFCPCGNPAAAGPSPPRAGDPLAPA